MIDYLFSKFAAISLSLVMINLVMFITGVAYDIEMLVLAAIVLVPCIFALMIFTFIAWICTIIMKSK